VPQLPFQQVQAGICRNKKQLNHGHLRHITWALASLPPSWHTVFFVKGQGRLLPAAFPALPERLKQPEVLVDRKGIMV